MSTLPSLNAIISRLHMKQLRLLVALDTCGSLLKAAEKVGLTQPGASKALQEIESALGVALFTRTNRGLEPNKIGHCVIRYARLIQTDLAHLREEMIGILQGQAERMTVGVIMGAVPMFTEVLSAFLLDKPDLSVEIIEANSQTLLRLIDDGRAEFAICETSISQQPELYQTHDLRQEQLAVVAHIDHPLMRQESLQLSELADARWLVYSANMPMRLLLEREFQLKGLRFPPHLLETTSAFTTVSLLHRNPGLVALLPTEVAQYFADFKMMGILPYRLESRSDRYELVTRAGSVLSPVAQRFVLKLKEYQGASAQLPTLPDQP
jgi:DNA-binding transcriptional LysR family regulator